MAQSTFNSAHILRRFSYWKPTIVAKPRPVTSPPREEPKNQKSKNQKAAADGFWFFGPAF
jgi:hypothetical protein